MKKYTVRGYMNTIQDAIEGLKKEFYVLEEEESD